MFLIAYAADQRGWKDVMALFEDAEDEIAALASGLSWHALRAVERGPLRSWTAWRTTSSPARYARPPKPRSQSRTSL